MAYSDIYSKRLNRYGNDYQSRVLGEREKLFEEFLLKTLYRVDFVYDYQTHPGSFEKNSQDNTETTAYLLTRLSLNLPAGTVLQIPDKNGDEQPWMVYYLENIKQSGYNRYIMLKMSHEISWTDSDSVTHSTYAYMYGQEDNMLKDEIRSRSRMDTIYSENMKLYFFVCPLNQYIQKDMYFTVGTAPYTEHYRVTGYDRQSAAGVMYVSADPVYEYDLSAPPTKQTGDEDTDFYWFNGGASDGT